MNEMDKFEDELNKIEPETIEDEEFKKKLYRILMEKYEKKKRFGISPFIKISITIGLILVLLIPLYLILSPLRKEGIQKRGEPMIMEKSFSLLDNLTRNDELLNSYREGGREILKFKSGLRIVKKDGTIEEISYGERNFSLPKEGLYLGSVKEDVENIKGVVERDKKIGFVMKNGKIEDVRRIDKDLFYIIISSYGRRWGVVVNVKEDKVLAFFSPPE